MKLEPTLSLDLTVNCPFCQDDDFDLIGLKMHLTFGWCDVYENLELYPSFKEKDEQS